uniref:CUB_2 domain-containing protein n=1 Tax=Caenorhabditis tropicalis TaxID=1561998 RepID=A0A1I7U4R5_9PELO
MILWKFLFLVSSLSIAQATTQDCNLYSTMIIQVQLPNENISYWNLLETIEMKPYEVGKLVFMKPDPGTNLAVISVNTASLKVSVDNHGGHDTINYIAQGSCSDDVQTLKIRITRQSETQIYERDLKYVVRCQPIDQSNRHVGPLEWLYGDICTNPRVSDVNDKVCVSLSSEKQLGPFKFPSGSHEIMMCLVEGHQKEELLGNTTGYRVLGQEEIARNNNLSLIRVDFETLKPGIVNVVNPITRRRDGTTFTRSSTITIVPGFFDYWKSSKWSSILENQTSINLYSLFNVFIYYPESGRMDPVEYTTTFGQFKLERKRNEDCELVLVVQGNCCPRQSASVHGQSSQTGGIYEGWTGQLNNAFFRIPFSSIQKQLDFEQFKFVIAGTYNYTIDISAVNEFPSGSSPIDGITDGTTAEPSYETTGYYIS